MFEYGQAYVALSRIRSLETCRIIKFDPSRVRAHASVVGFYKNFHSQTDMILKLIAEGKATEAAADAAATAARLADEKDAAASAEFRAAAQAAAEEAHRTAGDADDDLLPTARPVRRTSQPQASFLLKRRPSQREDPVAAARSKVTDRAFHAIIAARASASSATSVPRTPNTSARRPSSALGVRPTFLGSGVGAKRARSPTRVLSSTAVDSKTSERHNSPEVLQIDDDIEADLRAAEAIDEQIAAMEMPSPTTSKRTKTETQSSSLASSASLMAPSASASISPIKRLEAFAFRAAPRESSAPSPTTTVQSSLKGPGPELPPTRSSDHADASPVLASPSGILRPPLRPSTFLPSSHQNVQRTLLAGPSALASGLSALPFSKAAIEQSRATRNALGVSQASPLLMGATLGQHIGVYRPKDLLAVNKLVSPPTATNVSAPKIAGVTPAPAAAAAPTAASSAQISDDARARIAANREAAVARLKMRQTT